MPHPSDTHIDIQPAGMAVLHTRSGAHPLRVRVAASFITRFAGLMLRKPLPPDQALLLTDCPNVHTLFMRCAIDVVYLDQSGTVRKCVSGLKPWRGSFSHTGRNEQGERNKCAAHTLELAAGSIDRLCIGPGDRLQHSLWQDGGAAHGSEPHLHQRQRGSAMIEFTLVGPLITLLGLAVLQYGMLFFAKNHINHAAFMAARAGSMGNADQGRIENAYLRALVPVYGGGLNQTELQNALDEAREDLTNNPDVAGKRFLRIELLNPTRESFDDWNDPALQATVGGGKRVIPNTALASADPNAIGGNSGQSIHDANLIKLRITHGVDPRVPLMKSIYTAYLKWLDTGGDSFHTDVVNAGRIPVVTHVTLHMQSDAIEPDDAVSSPGAGNNGNPADPGNPPVTSEPPPDCATIGCTVISIPETPEPTPPTENCVNGNCVVCVD